MGICRRGYVDMSMSMSMVLYCKYVDMLMLTLMCWYTWHVYWYTWYVYLLCRWWCVGTDLWMVCQLVDFDLDFDVDAHTRRERGLPKLWAPCHHVIIAHPLLLYPLTFVLFFCFFSIACSSFSSSIRSSFCALFCSLLCSCLCSSFFSFLFSFCCSFCSSLCSSFLILRF